MSGNTKPIVSAIIPHYDRPQLLGRALESIGSQVGLEESQLEVIVIDDASGLWSETSEVLRAFREKSKFSFRAFRHKSNYGPGAARNTAASVSRAGLLAFLDSDDLWLPSKLKSQLDFHESAAGAEYKLSQTDEKWIRDGKRVNKGKRHALPSGEFFLRSLELCLVSPSSVMLQKSLFFEVGGFDERLRLCEDYDLWLRIAKENLVGLLPELLVEKYAGHSDQLSISEPALDRYRVFSLCKLSDSETLEDQQLEALQKVLRLKLGLLLEGARKRDNISAVSIYESLLQSLEMGEKTMTETIEADYLKKIIPQKSSRACGLTNLDKSDSFSEVQF